MSALPEETTVFVISNVSSWTLPQYERASNDCEEYLAALENWSAIPTINRDSLDCMKDGAFVRFTGMVQDVLNPEYFSASYNVRNAITNTVTTKCGKYRDLLHCDLNEEFVEDNEIDVKSQEVRHPLFCIPTPGKNSWAAEVVQNSDLNPPSSGLKRAHEEDSENESVLENRSQRKCEVKLEESSIPSKDNYSCEKYFPLSETGGLACIVKHYGEHEDWLVNTRIEVVGFLSVSAALEASWQDSDAEDRAMHPPPSLVPRIHALAVRKVKPSISNSLVPEEKDFALVRSDLVTTLTQLLFGDTLAAEYLLLNLLSSVYARKDCLAIGGLSLNLHNVLHVPDYPKKLYEVLQSIVECSVYLPLSIDLLNTSAFVPRKDYNSNKLWSGRLQLADETHLIVDESCMEAGQLCEAGLKNMVALHSLALHQQLRYDFTYFQLDFHTNIPTIVLSEAKSLIPTNVVLKVQPEPDAIPTILETFDAARFFLSGERLEAVRKYVAFLRQREFDMDGTEFVGAAWADLRQANGKLQQEDLHRLLVLSRLLALSNGRCRIIRADWDNAVVMENARSARS